jgi:hypothetical protein
MATVLHYEIPSAATFAAAEQILPAICKNVRLRHIAGADDAEITFAANGTTAQVKLSPAAGTYAQEVEMYFTEGFDRVRCKSASPDATVEVTAWR